MNNKRFAPYIVGGIIVLLVVFAISTYNGLVKKEERVKLQWNEVQNAYQRRIDLIPNLVNVVKGQTDFEQGTLIQLTEARSKATAIIGSANEITAENFNQQSEAQNQLASAANRFVITIEKYPQLKGAEAFAGLQVQLEGTERRIKFARKDFNTAIADYNSSVRAFPAKMVAGVLGFHAKEGFQSDAGADKSIEIKF
ncbi:MAG: LemA family protein [Ferruginibacter sp.]